jgi:DNA adenine methylase
MKLQPVIKWSGSKRSQADYIINLFPKEIDIYYEPFVGGASVLFNLLHSDIKVKKYICSDINNDLISLWNRIKENPQELYEKYNLFWIELNKDEDIERRKEFFYLIRKRFNQMRYPSDFLFLSRTCVNGLIRYNSKGEFNTSLHFSRGGINPNTLMTIINDWSSRLNKYNVEFICRDYSDIRTNINDFVYLDPPYANTKGMYFGKIDYDKFWNYLRQLKSNYIFSFDGRRSEINNTYTVPTDIYTRHVYVSSGKSSFKCLKDQKVGYVEESLYIKTMS